MQPMMPPPAAGPVAPVKRKGGIALVLGVLFLAGGIVLGIVLAVTGVVGVSKAVDDMQRVPAPGTGTVEIDRTGTYHLFYEDPPGLVGSGYDDFYRSDIAITAPSGALLPISTSSRTDTYDFGDHHGRSIGEFRADETGTYRIRTRSADVSEGGEFSFGPTGAIAVSDDSPLEGLWKVLFGVFGGGALVLLGIVLLIVGGVRRSRSRRAAYVAPPVSGWGTPPPGAWAGSTPQAWSPPGASGPGAPQPWAPPGSTTPPPQPWTPPSGPASSGPQPWTPPPVADPPPPPGWVPPPSPPSGSSSWPDSPSEGPIS